MTMYVSEPFSWVSLGIGHDIQFVCIIWKIYDMKRLFAPRGYAWQEVKIEKLMVYSKDEITTVHALSIPVRWRQYLVSGVQRACGKRVRGSAPLKAIKRMSRTIFKLLWSGAVI